jgi:hypothetical protein
MFQKAISSFFKVHARLTEAGGCDHCTREPRANICYSLERFSLSALLVALRRLLSTGVAGECERLALISRPLSGRHWNNCIINSANCRQLEAFNLLIRVASFATAIWTN